MVRGETIQRKQLNCETSHLWNKEARQLNCDTVQLWNPMAVQQRGCEVGLGKKAYRVMAQLPCGSSSQGNTAFASPGEI